MFDWSGKNGNKSGKSQGILISYVNGNPDKDSKDSYFLNLNSNEQLGNYLASL